MINKETDSEGKNVWTVTEETDRADEEKARMGEHGKIEAGRGGKLHIVKYFS